MSAQRNLPPQDPLALQQEEFGHFALATGLQRLVAYLLDLFFLGSIQALIVAALEFGLNNGQEIGWKASLLISMNLLLLYWCAPLYFNGQTLGKKILGLRVVPQDYSEFLGLWQILGRETLGRWAATLFLGFGYLRCFTSRDRQGWHDILFNTQVVDLNKIRE